ncbi:hypothetical protein H2199_003458 [Coniosporium tulheliwenetii]|nr:hypothetical protein H2199_003458 [Cladosporium sp. JES 115]
MTLTQVLTVTVDGTPSVTTVTIFPTESATDGALPKDEVSSEDEMSSDDEASSQDDATVVTITQGWTTTQVDSVPSVTAITVSLSEGTTDETLSEDTTVTQGGSGPGLMTVTVTATQGAADGTLSQDSTATQVGSEPGLTTVTVLTPEDITTATLSQDSTQTQVAGVSVLTTVTVTSPPLAGTTSSSPSESSPSQSSPSSHTRTWWRKIFWKWFEKVDEPDSTAESSGSFVYPTYRPSGSNGVFYGNVTRSGSAGASAVYLVPSGFGQAGPSNVATGVASMATGTTNSTLRPSNSTATSSHRSSYLKIHLDLATLIRTTIENIRVSRRTYEVNVELFAGLSWRSEGSEIDATANQQGSYRPVTHILDGTVINMFGNNTINYYHQTGDKVYYSKFCSSCPITPVMKQGDSYVLPPPCEGCANPVMLAKPGQGDVMQVPNNEKVECGLVEYEPPTCVNCEDMPAAPSDTMTWNSPWSSTTTLSGVVSEPTADQSGEGDSLVTKEICVTKPAYLNDLTTELCLNLIVPAATQTSASTASPNQGALNSQTPTPTGGSNSVAFDGTSSGAGASSNTSGPSIVSSGASTTAISATSPASAQQTAPVQAGQAKAVVQESSETTVAVGQPRTTSIGSKQVTGMPSTAPAQSTEALIANNSAAKFAGSSFGVFAGLVAAFFLL